MNPNLVFEVKAQSIEYENLFIMLKDYYFKEFCFAYKKYTKKNPSFEDYEDIVFNVNMGEEIHKANQKLIKEYQKEEKDESVISYLNNMIISYEQLIFLFKSGFINENVQGDVFFQLEKLLKENQTILGVTVETELVDEFKLEETGEELNFFNMILGSPIDVPNEYGHSPRAISEKALEVLKERREFDEEEIGLDLLSKYSVFKGSTKGYYYINKVHIEPKPSIREDNLAFKFLDFLKISLQISSEESYEDVEY